MFKIHAILYPNIFIEDTELSEECKPHLIQVHAKEFNKSPIKDAQVERDHNGKWNVLSKVVDENCLNGICSLAMPDNH